MGNQPVTGLLPGTTCDPGSSIVQKEVESGGWLGKSQKIRVYKKTDGLMFGGSSGGNLVESKVVAGGCPLVSADPSTNSHMSPVGADCRRCPKYCRSKMFEF